MPWLPYLPTGRWRSTVAISPRESNRRLASSIRNWAASIPSEQAGALKQLADLLVKPEDGRLARTITNRLWAHLFGRGIVEPVDNMDAAALERRPARLAGRRPDGPRLRSQTHAPAHLHVARAINLPSVGLPDPTVKTYTFAGPQTKRMSAEQFVDALSSLSGAQQAVTPDMLKVDGRGQGGQVAAVAAVDGERQEVRAALMFDDPLNRAWAGPTASNWSRGGIDRHHAARRSS